MLFFGVEIPTSTDILVKIRFITGRGKPFIAWEGCSDTKETDALDEMSRSQIVHAYIKRAAANQRLKPDENGGFNIQAKVICYEAGQLIYEGLTEILIYPIEPLDSDEQDKKNTSIEVIQTLVDSLTRREESVHQMMEQVNRMHQSYETAISKISKHSLEAMDKVSGHASSAFNAAASPFAEMGKTLVKSLDESRSSVAIQAKEAQEQLIRSLTNRIVEGNKVQQKQGLTQDIKEVLELLPLLRGFLDGAEPKA